MGPESLAGGVGPLPACRSAQGVLSRGSDGGADPPLLTDTMVGPESLAGGVGGLPLPPADPPLQKPLMESESLAGGVGPLPPACSPAQGSQGKGSQGKGSQGKGSQGSQGSQGKGGAGSPQQWMPREGGWKPAEKRADIGSKTTQGKSLGIKT